MKKVKIHGAFLVLMLGILGRAQSQQKYLSGAQDSAVKQTEWMKTNLALNNEQVSQVSKINFKYATKNEDLKDSPLNSREKILIVQQNDRAKDVELKSVLTTGQFTAWQSKKELLQKEVK